MYIKAFKPGEKLTREELTKLAVNYQNLAEAYSSPALKDVYQAIADFCAELYYCYTEVNIVKRKEYLSEELNEHIKNRELDKIFCNKDNFKDTCESCKHQKIKFTDEPCRDCIERRGYTHIRNGEAKDEA